MAQTETRTGLFHHPLDQLEHTTKRGREWLTKNWKRTVLAATALIGLGYVTYNQVKASTPGSESLESSNTSSASYQPRQTDNSFSMVDRTSPPPIDTPFKRLEQAVAMEKTHAMLSDINQKIDAIYEMRESWQKVGTRYTVQKGDTWESIAKQHNTTPDKILKLNGLNKSQLWPSQVFSVPINPLPAPHFAKIIDQARADLANLEKVKLEKGANSEEAKALSKDINTYWNTAPGKSNPIKPPEIKVDPAVKNADYITKKIQELNGYFPGVGRAVNRFVIVPRSFWPNYDHPAGAITEDKGTDIYIFEYPSKPDKTGHQQEWTDHWLLLSTFHEINHAIDPYVKFPSQLFTPKDLVDTIYTDTQISNKTYLAYPASSRVTIPDEALVQEAVLLLTTPNSTSLSPGRELEEEELQFAKTRVQSVLEPIKEFAKIGQELGLQP